MTHSSTQNSHCPEDLLIWFVNHTLPESQIDEVRVHLEQCDRCKQEVAWLQSVRDEIKGTPAQPPGELGLKRLMHRVSNEQKREPHQRNRRSHGWRPSLAIAASLIIILQAGLLLNSWFGTAPVRLLSDEQNKGVVLQVTFSPKTTEYQIREILNSVNGTIIGGPGALGVYRIGLDINLENSGALEKTLATLKDKGSLVTHVNRE